VLKAANALLKYVEKQNAEKGDTNLLGDDADSVHMIITIKLLSRNIKLVPSRIPLRNPLYDETKSVCLITKTSNSAEVAEKVEKLSFPQIQEVISVERLSKEYKPYEARRQLMSMHDLFLADHRIIHGLPKHLGSKFFQSKKFPLPVVIATGDIKAELTKALSSTMYKPAKGTTSAVKVGTTKMTAAQLAENIEGVAKCIAKYVPRGWENIESLGIKAGESLILPIYNSLTVASAPAPENPKENTDDAVEKPAVSAKILKDKKPSPKAVAKKPENKSKKSPLSRKRPAKDQVKKGRVTKSAAVAATSA
ncbi:proteasome-interacting protein cic1, partial [Coemansia sp. RSA 2598]